MRQTVLILAILITGACASVPPVVVPVRPPEITWEQKLGWMMRLEDQRMLRDPHTAPPVVLVPSTKDRPAIVAPPAPSDVIRLLGDQEARVRRRAALAAGRAGLAEAVEPLGQALSDQEVEVRQMAAFALGLIGNPAARPALLAALMDSEPIVQGRAAEALGLIGNRADAGAVSAMVQAHVRAGALSGIAPDDLTYPLTPAVEAARLGLYSLVRLGSYEAIASAVLDPAGQPVSHWWPVAYALQRNGDPKATPALMTLLTTAGRYTSAFAARGLGLVKAAAAVGGLMQIVQERQAPPAVVMQSVRALIAIGDIRAGPLMRTLATDAKADLALRLEALGAIGVLRPPDAVDVLLDLLSEPVARVRETAMRTLAQIDPDTFLTALSGLDPDRDWTVRAAQATALGTLSGPQAAPQLTVLLKDRDQRVIPSVLNALVASHAPGTEALLLARLVAEDPVVRATAAAGLGQLMASAAVRPLADAFRTWQADPSYIARAAALATLVKIDPQAARPVLQEALADRDWAVRVRAEELLRAMTSGSSPADPGPGPDPALTIRPAPSGRLVSDQEWAWLLNPPYSPHAYIETDRGTIEVELAVLDAPQTVANFMDLVRRGFFNGVPIHRVVPDFVVQDGDPRGDGEGGPGYSIRDEINELPMLRGTLGMALDWKDTGGSQFFIAHSPQPHLDGKYTVFGQVVTGLDVLDQIQQWDIIRKVTVWDGVAAR